MICGGSTRTRARARASAPCCASQSSAKSSCVLPRINQYSAPSHSSLLEDRGIASSITCPWSERDWTLRSAQPARFAQSCATSAAGPDAELSVRGTALAAAGAPDVDDRWHALALDSASPNASEVNTTSYNSRLNLLGQKEMRHE